MSGIQLWGGVECTVNRVHDRYPDQMGRSGHDVRPDDLDRFAACGFTALRYPVLWERVAPFARAVVAGIGLDGNHTAPCVTREAWQPAARPGYGVLGSERGVLLPPLASAIATYCSEMAVRLAETSRCASS